MRARFAVRIAPLAVVLASAAVACGGEQPPPKTASDTPTATPPPPAAPKAPDSPTTSDVSVAPDIAKACGIQQPDAYFSFDSSNVRAKDSRVLGQIATCFMKGPLEGRTLRLVGHADPRGASDYNMTLGQSRADSVAVYMRSKGMDKGKTESTSRGAMDATGSDDSGWAHDRRVDLTLGQ